MRLKAALVTIGLSSIIGFLLLRASQPVRDSERVPRAREEAQTNSPETKRARTRTATRTKAPIVAPDAIALGAAAVGDDVRTATTDLASAVASDPRQASYQACIKAARGFECSSLYLDIVNQGLAMTGAKARAQRVWKAYPDHERSEVGMYLASRLDESQDPLERVVTLTLLEGYESQEVSDAAYENVTSRPFAEARLLARRHMTRPCPSADVASEFVSLAQVPETRVRREAIRALGHQETSEQLLRALTAAPLEPSDWKHVAITIRACGGACLDSLEYVLSLDERRIRELLYEQLVFAEDAEKGALTQPLLALRVSDDEAKVRSSFLENKR